MSIINMSSSCSSIDLGSSFTAFAVALAFGFLLAMGAPRPTRYKDLLRLHEQQDAGLHVLACAVMRMISCVAQDKQALATAYGFLRHTYGSLRHCYGDLRHRLPLHFCINLC